MIASCLFRIYCIKQKHNVHICECTISINTLTNARFHEYVHMCLCIWTPSFVCTNRMCTTLMYTWTHRLATRTVLSVTREHRASYGACGTHVHALWSSTKDADVTQTHIHLAHKAVTRNSSALLILERSLRLLLRLLLLLLLLLVLGKRLSSFFSHTCSQILIRAQAQRHVSERNDNDDLWMAIWLVLLTFGGYA